MTEAQRKDLWKCIEQDERILEEEFEDSLQFPDSKEPDEEY